jgi:hypothetical protein
MVTVNEEGPAERLGSEFDWLNIETGTNVEQMIRVKSGGHK